MPQSVRIRTHVPTTQRVWSSTGSVLAVAMSCLFLFIPGTALAQLAGGSLSVAAVDLQAVRTWDQGIDSWLRTGEVQLTRVDTDTIVPGRTHERLSQYHRGVPVFGGALTRQLAGGLTLSVFGTVYRGIDVDTVPTLSADDVTNILAPALDADVSGSPALVVFPRDDAGYSLAYTIDAWSNGDLVKYFIDAHTGDILHRYSNLWTQEGVIATGTGVLGDTKKVSVSSRPNHTGFLAEDRQRPASITTFDLGFNFSLGVNAFHSSAYLSSGDVASDLDNVWTDPTTVDTHAYMGWTYDYLYERFGLSGLNGRNSPIRAIVHWLNPNLYWTYPPEYRGYLCNAFYNPSTGFIMIGDGLPAEVGKCNPLAGAFDVVAHELAHGVTRYSSNLIYENESGALNEAFSDIIGVGAEFFHAARGNGLPYALNYTIGDTVLPGGLRDMAEPENVRYKPNHYSARRIGTWDNGYVHTNSTIVSHAFYLAIEGGENRTSGLSVQGVGPGRRADIERAFFRAFVYMLPENATMSMARTATISAGVTYGAEAAIRDAWDAVGVNANQEVTIQYVNLRRRPPRYWCGADRSTDPDDVYFSIRISTGSTGFSVIQEAGAIYSSTLGQVGSWQRNATQFADEYGQSYIPPETTIEGSLRCYSASYLHGRNVSVQRQVTGVHTSGEQVTHYSGRY